MAPEDVPENVPEGTRARPITPITERSEFRWWTGAVTFAALAALLVAVIAVAMANSAKSSTGRTKTVAVAESAGPKIDFSATAPPGFKPRDPVAPPTAPGTVHQITLHAKEGQLEIAPGHVQEMWSFNGTVPGPVLRGKVGDTFEVTLVNDGTNGHSIDFHASKVAWNVEMRTINPGESLVYRFEAKHAGIFMYHCGTPPVIHHIGNGMYGAIIIDPPDLPPVDHELVMLQSELYTAPPGQVADVAKMLAEKWDAVVFNGYVNQYKFAPIRVEPGQRVRIWVLDEGPSENSSFHVIGTIFDTVFKEGTYTLRPGPSLGGSQALDLQPAQGGFVEFTFDVPGMYPFVTHKFASASKGALGLFQAGDVKMPAAGGGH